MANQADGKLICELNNNGNSNGQNYPSDMTIQSKEDPRKLIPELCNHFYHLGWASG